MHSVIRAFPSNATCSEYPGRPSPSARGGTAYSASFAATYPFGCSRTSTQNRTPIGQYRHTIPPTFRYPSFN